jgi:N-acetylglucosaminyltransferase II (MGAT2)
LQHPLQIFGNHTIDKSELDQIADPLAFEKAALERRARREQERREMGNFDSERLGALYHQHGSSAAQQLPQLSQRNHLDDYARSRLAQKFDGGFHGSGVLQFKPKSITSTRFTESNTNVIFVYMVFKRVDYLKKAIESLTKSDYPRERLPLIISHDGSVPEVVQYVETIKKDYNIIQLFHPFSCYEHPDSFPGDDKKLNDGYKGDRFGKPRSAWATCCKHHFTWMVNQVFRMDVGPNLAVDTFLFMEEDYLVAPTVYQAIVAGSNILDSVGSEAQGGFLGLGLDPTNADKKTEPFWLEDTWHAEVFATGPMTLNRSVFAQLKAHADAYCTVDEYNWDWSLVHLGGMGYMPHTVLVPARVLAKHIGTSEGMHTEKRNVLEDIQERYPEQHQDDQGILHHSLRQRKAFDTSWAGKRVNGNLTVLPRKHAGYGGWGHPADQEHCLTLFHG